jgi:2-succinyl-5-enolpyruvyl-6-hydroxy-3-cyclohexene-1-carboxylate synthase
VSGTQGGSGGRGDASRPSQLRAFVEELARAGVRDAIVCPGSRSTPVALALRAHDRIRVRVLIDERSAGYFAVGLARTTRRAVVLLSTSGTAAVNFAPAVVEAELARVPLVVLTADRPPELRDRGAPQTIDQDRLYGRSAKWFAELALMDVTPDTPANIRRVAARAVATALEGPAGPVHLNLPLRDPLIPTEELGAIEASDGAGERPAGAEPFASVVGGRRILDEGQVAALAAGLAATDRGLIIAGPLDDPATHEPIARLAAATGYPILADPLSGMRTGPHDRSLVLVHADHLARRGAWLEAHRPEIVVRFGAMPTSKPVTELMQSARPELFVVDGGGGWREAALIAATFVHADPAAAAAQLAAAVTKVHAAGSAGPLGARPLGIWPRAWLAAEAAADRALKSWLAGLAEPFEGAPFPTLGELLPEGALLWAGNSMPVRDLDAWLPAGERSIRVLANRGANGIDGVTSTALGSAAAGSGRVVLVVGDLSFLHDLTALVTARLHPQDLLVILVNNDGGGIFSLLPQARTSAPEVGLPARYEELFGTPHGIAIGPIAEAFGFRHRVAGPDDLRGAIAAELGRPGLAIVELRTERGRNAVLHREAAAAVASALAGLPGEDES